MKWFTYICCSICLFTLLSAMAEVPITMSGPTPAIENSYAIGDANILIYTITNNVSNKNFPITVNGISTPMSRTTVTNDCGNNVPVGPSTCNIGILIAPTSNNGGQSFNQNLTVDYQGRTPFIQNISFSVSPFAAILTAAGQDFTGTSPPLLAVSNDGLGATWTVKSIVGLPTDGFFDTTSCSGNGTNAICIAAGKNADGMAPPFLAQSTDGGTTWAVQSITGLPATGIFFATSCTGSDATALCIAAGAADANIETPLLAQSTDGGTTWATQSITGLPINGDFQAASCTGSGPTAICIAAGENFTGSSPPLLVQSTDGGAIWTVQSISGLPASGTFNGASCAGSDATAICTVVGEDTTGAQPPLLAQSIDGGATWSVKAISGLPTSGNFQSVGAISRNGHLFEKTK